MNNQSLDQSIDILSKALKDLAESRQGQFKDTFLDFHAEQGETNYGKGVIWSGSGYTKQFIFSDAPDRFFSSESIDLAKGKSISVNNIKVLDDKELGSTVVKSNLREVGRLNGLVVDGSVSINQYLYYNGVSDRLGLGTDEPNAALSIADMGVEVMLGTTEQGHGMLGTFSSNDLVIVTDNTSRIAVKANGDIKLGVSKSIQVTVNGKLSVGVAVPDPAVDLHVAGAIRFNNRLHMYSESVPTVGNYHLGDIIWNTNPRVDNFVGWVCTRAGSPGIWSVFGKIE
jgi:hypothetical protein